MTFIIPRSLYRRRLRRRYFKFERGWKLATSISGRSDAHPHTQILLEKALRLLDEAGLERSAVYAQRALDCLGEPESEAIVGAAL